LVSDGGGHIGPDPDPKTGWFRHTIRVLAIADRQVRALRKRQLFAAYRRRQELLAAGETEDSPSVRLFTRRGAYWGIRTNVDDYGLTNVLDAPWERTLQFAATLTRLAKLAAIRQEQLINWGYAVCDTALRTHVDGNLPKGTFPYDGGVG
jgi:NTE family protein